MDDQAGGRSVIDHEGALKGADHANDNNTYGQNDNSHPSNDSTALYVAQHESISEISKLREELRLMQEKLSQVDERTRLDSRAGMHDNFTTKTVNEKKARRGVPLRGIYNAPPRPVSIGRRETSEESGEESSEESNEENEATQWSLKPALNKVEWNIFESCRRTRKNESFVLDVLVGEPVLSDFHPTTYGHPKKTSFEGGRQGETYTETAVPGQEPLPERIRIHSIGLLKALDSIHGVGINSTNRLVMVRPFKFLTFYQTQIRQWLDKEQKELAADAGDCKRTTQTLLALCSSEATHSYLQTSETVSRQPDPTLLENELSIPGDVEPRSDQPPTCDRVKDNKPDRSRQERVMHVRCLLELIDSSISSKQNHLEKKAKKVSFIDLWHLFTVGTEIIENGDKHMQCYKVFKVISPKHKVAKRKKDFRLFRSKERPETSLFIHCVYVDFNGWLLGPVSKMFSITRYQGMRDIKSLPVYPLRFEDNSEEIRRRLIDRGNKFFKAVQLGHMHYSGLTLGSKDEVDGQVVIDFTEALNRPKVDKSEWVPEIQLRVGKEQEKPRRRDREYMYDSDSDDEKDYCQAGCCAGEDVLDDSFIDARQSEQYLADLLTGSDEDEGPAPLAVIAQVMQKAKEILVTEDDLVLMTYRVFGFVLRSRSWEKLDLTNLMDLDEYHKKREAESTLGGSKGENAFNNLVFPNDGLDRKKIVRSLVAQHFRDKESVTSLEEQLDIVRGKGKGLIILLHGAPGVGKTTTAEGIAEIFKKPLFQITCGDLGTTAEEVEGALERNFRLANKWGSILLLDEADVFLARRTPHDFQRNGLVAVFLRVLEYYAGILFLTTNRIGDFDEAFSSRINISLHYPMLDYNSTVRIFALNWRLMRARFDRKKRDLHIEETEITGFIAEYWHTHPSAQWNGRQIRNACQTALALAEFEAQTSGDDGVLTHPFAKVYLAVSHMRTVSDAYLEFIKYLQDVRDADQERYAFLMGIRRQEGKDVAPENPLAYSQSTPIRRGQVSRLAEHRARSAARYHHPEQSLYPPRSPYAYAQGNQPGHHPGSSGGGGVGTSPYEAFSRQPSATGTSPYPPPPLEPQGSLGWNPGPVGGYYAGSQETQPQQRPPQGAEVFPGSHPYAQHTQPGP